LAPALPVILAALAVPVGELRNDGEASLECKNGESYDDQPTCAQASQKWQSRRTSRAPWSCPARSTRPVARPWPGWPWWCSGNDHAVAFAGSGW